ncbi:low molecular weight protein-tyrosine-phosphatase [Luteimonas suaedae]|uniref:low molecular weight protein-tyrosine-phosphatase n=1 Tax=Luteimonas suaedae TaxID=2605430 RepID=UPI0011EFEA17|nr:low molecular weight protein-tyrosine-phosphatase [Luteimonas suaedae]
MPKRVLFVCTANICRSPTAEAMLRHRFTGDDIAAASAGLIARAGHPIDPRAEAALAAHGLTAGDHVARQLTPALIAQADIVLAMEKRHLAALNALAPDAHVRTFLLGKWLGNADIPDPYRGDDHDFERSCRLIGEALEHWCRRLPDLTKSRCS